MEPSRRETARQSVDDDAKRYMKRLSQQNQNGARKILPRMDQHFQARIASLQATPNYRLGGGGKLWCQLCSSVPEGFRNAYCLKRHIRNKHSSTVTQYICRDPTLVGLPSELMPVVPLEDCKRCRSGSTYGQYYNAAAHLRRCHFNKTDTVGDDKTSTSPRRYCSYDPPMEKLWPWLEAIAVQAQVDLHELSKILERSEVGGGLFCRASLCGAGPFEKPGDLGRHYRRRHKRNLFRTMMDRQDFGTEQYRCDYGECTAQRERFDSTNILVHLLHVHGEGVATEEDVEMRAWRRCKRCYVRIAAEIEEHCPCCGGLRQRRRDERWWL